MVDELQELQLLLQKRTNELETEREQHMKTSRCVCLCACVCVYVSTIYVLQHSLCENAQEVMHTHTVTFVV